MDTTTPKGGDKKDGGRKAGRKPKYARYRAEGRREKNRALRLARTIKREAKLAGLREKRGH